MNKKIKIIIVLVLTLILSIGGIYYMQKESQNPHLSEKETKLYKHGFQLLEEQIATYLKEHYSGISKIEFSPIFIDGGDGYSMLTIRVVPVIYDKYGNKAYIGKDIGNFSPLTPGLSAGIYSLEFASNGKEIIYLSNSKNGVHIDVSEAEHLPEDAKLRSYPDLDENIQLLAKDKQLEGVVKNQNGSKNVNVIYNLQIQRGEYWKWQ